MSFSGVKIAAITEKCYSVMAFSHTLPQQPLKKPRIRHKHYNQAIEKHRD